MKVVIDIPEEDYETLKEVNELGGELKTDIASRNMKAIANGTPLPKNHGRLMILSEDKLKENQIDLNFSCQKWISEVGLSYATVAIIEAESEEKNEDSN